MLHTKIVRISPPLSLATEAITTAEATAETFKDDLARWWENTYITQRLKGNHLLLMRKLIWNPLFWLTRFVPRGTFRTHKIKTFRDTAHIRYLQFKRLSALSTLSQYIRNNTEHCQRELLLKLGEYNEVEMKNILEHNHLDGILILITLAFATDKSIPFLIKKMDRYSKETEEEFARFTRELCTDICNAFENEMQAEFLDGKKKLSFKKNDLGKALYTGILCADELFTVTFRALGGR